jgi:cell division protein FtsA
VFGAKRKISNGLFVMDVGTSEVRAVALVGHAGDLHVVAQAVGPAPQNVPGALPDLESFRDSVGEVLQRVAWESGVTVRRVVASVGGAHVRSMRAQGRLQMRRTMPLREAHVQRVLDMAADLDLPRDHEVLHVVPTSFRVDDVPTHRPPIGMRAQSLCAEVSVVTVSRLALDNLERVLDSLDWQLVDAAAEPIVTARAALGREDRQRGAILLDIGAEVLHAASYRDGALLGIASLAAGSAHVTRDLSWALRLDVEEAESLKKQYGVAVVDAARRELRIPVHSNGRAAWVGQRAVAQVIEPRLSELLVLIRDGLRAQGALIPAARVVLTGNGARLRGLNKLVERIFAAPAHAATFRACEQDNDSAVPGCVAAGLIDYVRSAGLGRERHRRQKAWRWLVRTLGAGASEEKGTGLRAGSEAAGATSTH